MAEFKLQGGMGDQEGRNARFWIFTMGMGGWVKITLRPNQRLDQHDSHPTDEGYTAFHTSWVHNGDHVECNHCSWGRDCDGRYESGSVELCQLDELMGGAPPTFSGQRPEEIEGVRVPLWQPVDSHRRDYSAEAAGY